MHSTATNNRVIRNSLKAAADQNKVLTVEQNNILKKVLYHHQWAAVCKNHAKLLVDNRTKILEKFRPVNDILKASSVLSPDEWYIITALRFFGTNQDKTLVDRVLCAAYIDKDDADHPATFEQLYAKENIDDGTGGPPQSLVEILGKVYDERLKTKNSPRKKDYTSLTMRKLRINHKVEAKVLHDMLVDMWTDPMKDPRSVHSHCGVQAPSADKCFYISARTKCQRPNPWIEFRVAYKGRGLSMGQIRQMYKDSLEGTQDLIPKTPYTDQNPRPKKSLRNMFDRHVCSHSRERQQ
jgi:hypothetical protein